MKKFIIITAILLLSISNIYALQVNTLIAVSNFTNYTAYFHIDDNNQTQVIQINPRIPPNVLNHAVAEFLTTPNQPYYLEFDIQVGPGQRNYHNTAVVYGGPMLNEYSIDENQCLDVDNNKIWVSANNDLLTLLDITVGACPYDKK